MNGLIQYGLDALTSLLSEVLWPMFLVGLSIVLLLVGGRMITSSLDSVAFPESRRDDGDDDVY